MPRTPPSLERQLAVQMVSEMLSDHPTPDEFDADAVFEMQNQVERAIETALSDLYDKLSAMDLLAGYYQQRRPIVLKELKMTCSACPSQWEGMTTNGLHFYARYRWGWLTWGLGDSADAAITGSLTGGLQLGDPLDGTMPTSEMLKRINARVMHVPLAEIW